MAGSRLTPLLDGGRYFEAPRWHDHRLWLVDSVARTLISVTPAGTAEIACALEGMPAGLGFLPSGEAVVTDMHGRSLVRCAGGRPVVDVDLSALSGTIDDMIVDKVGRTYVGDLGFDLKSGIKNPMAGSSWSRWAANRESWRMASTFRMASRYPTTVGSWSLRKRMATAWRASTSAPTDRSNSTGASASSARPMEFVWTAIKRCG
jgi:sugar lactone lactonase YvrE